MPGFDRTGPMGEGPKTGRQLGRCNSKQQTQSAGVDQDQQMNRGRRLGAGRRADGGGRRGGGSQRRGGGGRFQQ
ncbi:MAG: hypothetical protein BBJ60_00725 [Desulfobacterales bacterium S7086C20]|nr:MAG: hypothetical protein BBJ60_00725 [Desulfobacterales bacterium S7086C20]